MMHHRDSFLSLEDISWALAFLCFLYVSSGELPDRVDDRFSLTDLTPESYVFLFFV